MKNLVASLDRLSLRPVLALLAVIVLLAGWVVLQSLRGQPDELIHFSDTVPAGLADNEDIEGSITLDHDSYVLGQHAHGRVRVLYRPAAVAPDFDRFKRNLGFLPFDQIGVTETTINHGNGVSEFQLDYELHVIGARKPGSYTFDPVQLFYARAGQSGSNLQSIRILRPELRIGSLYPWNAGLIPLRDIRGPVFDQAPFRRLVMLMAATVCLLAGGWIAWRFGRRRHTEELTAAERLWKHYHALDCSALGNRKYLLACERIFTGLLAGQAGIDPDSFWTGLIPEDEKWRTRVSLARQLLGRLYQDGQTPDSDVREMDELLSGMLAEAVQQQRLKAEQQPTFGGRLRQHPLAVRSAGFAFGVSVVMVALALRPELWVAPELRNYNATLDKIAAATRFDDALLQDLQAFAASAQNSRLRAAALYNSGTVRARYGFASLTPRAQQQMLDLIFQAESADALLETVMLADLAPSQEDVVTLLVNAAENLAQAELDLQSSTRFGNGEDEDALRNLELVTRWRHAILTRLVELKNMFSMKPGTNEEDVISDQGLVNVIEAKLPEEYEDAEMAKDNSHYIIFERF